jgi:hypothetical protein
MARKVVFVDDLDGTEISEEDGGPVEFSLAGKFYRIDLSSKNLTKLEKALAPFVAKAAEAEPPQPQPSRAPRGAGTRRTGTAPTGSGRSREQLDAIRTWARSQGMEVSDRGRIAANIQEAFDAAHKS